jgi:murein DD-endopeptidase MepM/ murein hydrolase activator NlpD
MKTKFTRKLQFLAMMLILITSIIPTSYGLAAPTPKPQMVTYPEMQWPFLVGDAWEVNGGFSDGTGKDGRTKDSPHYYLNGGALDIRPGDGLTGADTSNMWVVAAATGKIIKSTKCYVMLDHGNGVTSQYYHLDNVQDKVKRFISNPNESITIYQNEKMGVIANNKSQATCSGGEWYGPHLHFAVRPSMEGLSLSGWKIHYDNVKDKTTFTNGSTTYGLFTKILNIGTTPNNNNLPLTQINVDTSKTYQIQSVSSGKVLDIPNFSQEDGMSIIQYTAKQEDNKNQLWRFESLSGSDQGYYRIVSVLNGKCLDIQKASIDPAALLIQFTCNGGDNQKWKTYQSGDTIVLQVKHSGMVLTLGNASPDDGASIWQQVYGDVPHRKWKLVEASIPVIQPTPTQPAPPVPGATPQIPTPTPSTIPTQSVPWTKFIGNPYSRLYIDQNGNRANLTVCADNLKGKEVYYQFWRDGRSWNNHQTATSRCITFWDIDGAGPVLKNTLYYSRASIGAPPSNDWGIPCFEASGGYGLCNKVKR